MEKKAYHLIICLILSIMVVAPAAAQGFVQILDVNSNTTLDNGADQALESFYEVGPVLASLSGDDQVLESFYEDDWVLESFDSRVIFRIASDSNNEINSSYAFQPNWTQAGLEMVFVGCSDLQPGRADAFCRPSSIFSQRGVFDCKGHRVTAS